MAEADRQIELKDKLESGQTISQDDIRFLVDQSSISQRLLSGFGFIGTFSDELSETGRQTLVASGAKADIGVQVIMGNLGISTDEINENLQIGIATPLGGAGSRFGAATVGKGSDIFLRDIMSQKTPMGRAVWRAIAEHKKGLAIGAGAGVGLFALGQASPEEEPGREPGSVPKDATLPVDADPVSGTVLYVDPTTGEVIPITIEPGIADNFGVGPSGSVPSLSPELLELAAGLDVDASQLQQATIDETFLSSLNQWGEGSVSPSARPFGVTARGGAVTDAQDFQERRAGRGIKGVPKGLLRSAPPEGLARSIGATAVAPPGATLNRLAFEEIDGLTNLERAATAASKFGVPLDILYGTVNALSGWNAQAVGDNGRSFGLAQVSGDVTDPELSISPKWSLEYLARELRQGFQNHGNWEMAALAYRAPEAVSRFLAEGTMDPLAKAFLTDVLGGSQASGLGNNIFDFAGLSAIPDRRGGGGGGGPRIPPFQAPDPAELREFSRSAFASILGRDPTEDELTLGVEELTKGFRLAHDAQVTKLRGGKSTDVNPEARFIEQLEGSGEAQFREEVVTQRSVFDQMGDWARVLGEF